MDTPATTVYTYPDEETLNAVGECRYRIGQQIKRVHTLGWTDSPEGLNRARRIALELEASDGQLSKWQAQFDRRGIVFKDCTFGPEFSPLQNALSVGFRIARHPTGHADVIDVSDATSVEIYGFRDESADVRTADTWG